VPRNEDGEFELILGNRQLMSVFFIVVILLGVFFAMGYIVGRNSSPVGVPEVASRRPESKPLIETPAPQREGTPAPASVPTETLRSNPQANPQRRPRYRLRPRQALPRSFRPV